jgi:acyl-CoA dehydrogenase
MKPKAQAMDVIQWMLRQHPSANDPPLAVLEEWEAVSAPVADAWTDPMDRAIVGGFMGDRLAWAMAAGYGEALRRLLPDLPPPSVAALCVTETGGGHPRAIRTRLHRTGDSQWEMTGHKRFITHGDRADLLLVAATTGPGPDGRPRIRMVKVPAGASGVTVEPMPDLPFIPEIAHGTVHLQAVPVSGDQILSGDGYADLIKPFRTIEDLHIFGAVSGYLAATATRFGWPASCRSRLLAHIATLRSLSELNPLSPLVHILIHGVFSEMTRWMDDADVFWEKAPEEIQARWHRDRPLLGVAQTAREKRFDSAWHSFSHAGKGGPRWRFTWFNTP